MSTSVSDRSRRRILLAIAGICVASLAFWLMQNRLGGAGGPIALPKLIWLALTLFGWFLLPPILAADEVLPVSMRLAYRWFWFGMLARGAVELWMIYVTGNWHPYYGASHDVASAILLVWLTRRETGLFHLHALVTSAMLMVETGFALYFAAHFVTQGQHPTYFVPSDPKYRGMLVATVVADAGALAWFGYAWRRCLRRQ